MRLRWAFLLSVFAAFLACSSSDDGSPSELDGGGPADGAAPDAAVADTFVPPTETSSCVAYITAYCNKLASCTSPNVLDGCLENTALCPEYYFSPGTTRTIEGMVACAADIAQLDCTAFNAGVRPACVKAGTLEAGAPCITPAQCQSSGCEGFIAGRKCGTCAALYAPDAACTGDGTYGPVVCPLDERCDPASMRCKPITVPPLLAAGAACGGTIEGVCATGTFCLTTSADAGVTGTCGVYPSAGNPCARVANGSSIASCAEDAYCTYSNAQMTAGTCTAKAKSGETCGSPSPPTTITCTTGLYCKGGMCAAYEPIDAPCTAIDACGPNAYCDMTSPTSGTCRPFAMPGERCGTIPYDGGANYVQCTTKECQGESDGAPPTCRLAPLGRGADCTAPNTACYSVLTCTSGKCEPIDYASCAIADAGTD